MPIGPTGKISAAGRSWSRVCRIAVAISWPIMTSKSATEPHGTGSNRGCHHGCRSWIAPGGWAQQASILARSQPRGRNPSIIEPAKVVRRFMVFFCPWSVVRGPLSELPLRGAVVAVLRVPQHSRFRRVSPRSEPRTTDHGQMENCLLPTAYFQNDFPGQGTRALEGVLLQEPLGLGRRRQGEGPADDRLELALLDPSDHVGGASALLLRCRVEHGESE